MSLWLSADGNLITIGQGSSDFTDGLFRENLQDRGWAHLGKKSKGFARVNEMQLHSRRRNFDDFMQVSVGFNCCSHR